MSVKVRVVHDMYEDNKAVVRGVIWVTDWFKIGVG